MTRRSLLALLPLGALAATLRAKPAPRPRPAAKEPAPVEGDNGSAVIGVPEGTTVADVERLRHLFAEAASVTGHAGPVRIIPQSVHTIAQANIDQLRRIANIDLTD
ncbi:MAG: hypothetical protein KGK07_14390 [Chloroflexota bacterium]|nr:hypothetical protein [Chloroflexota bacterium]